MALWALPSAVCAHWMRGMAISTVSRTTTEGSLMYFSRHGSDEAYPRAPSASAAYGQLRWLKICKKTERDAHLVADHGRLIKVIEDALEDGKSVSVVHLAEHVSELVLEESVLILEAWIDRDFAAEAQGFGSELAIGREDRDATHTWR